MVGHRSLSRVSPTREKHLAVEIRTLYSPLFYPRRRLRPPPTDLNYSRLSGTNRSPHSGQIISSKFTRLISFGLITLPHFVQMVFSAASTLSKWIFLTMADKFSTVRYLFANL